jgi:hypothetical protein
MSKTIHNKIIEKETTGMISERTFELIREIINSGENFLVVMPDDFSGYVKKLKPVKGVECYKMTAVLENKEIADFLFVRFSDENIDVIEKMFSNEKFFIRVEGRDCLFDKEIEFELKSVIKEILKQKGKNSLLEIYGISPKDSNMSKWGFTALGLTYLMDN